MIHAARPRHAPRSTLALIAQRRLWPSHRTYPGIAHDWQGTAWVAFQLAAAGADIPVRVFDEVGRRVAAALEAPPAARDAGRSPPRIGAMIGGAADAVVAAYAARLGVVRPALARAATRRAAAMARQSPLWDVHMGLSGTLLALLEIEAVAPHALGDVQPRRLADRLLAQMDALCALPPHGWPTGMAHGPVGAIMALEACGVAGWCRITTAHRQRWLDLLSRTALAPEDGGLMWPTIAGAAQLGMQSWCAGTPGIALALLQCFRLSHEPVYLEVAREALAGTATLFARPFHSPTLCCGSAGYRHIFVEAYRVTGEDAWLALAARQPRLARSARPWSRLGLHQGELGAAYLADRLANPAALPLPALGASSVAGVASKSLTS
jgi:Lanthionine synthetase C-like protein